MKITAEFVKSAAGDADFPKDGVPEVALVGRSNVGKSSLINALVRQRIARTSSTPGKTRLANLYRVARGTSGRLYLVDLPGYGYTGGGPQAAHEFDELTTAFFERAGRRGVSVGALLLIDARHPGLPADTRAWNWLRAGVDGRAAVVATKIDKLARGERSRSLREIESVMNDPVLAVSAVTGEGLDELWKAIDRLANGPKPRPRRNPEETAPPRRKS